MSDITAPVLVTSAAGHVGGVGRRVVTMLRELGVPVRAAVRQEDERTAQLHALGAEVVVADLTKMEEVFPIVQGCRRIYFSMSLTPQYVEATTVMAMAARAAGNVELIVNMSQLPVSFTSPTEVAESPQQRLHYLSEEVLNWCGVPVTHLRPTLFHQIPLLWGLSAASIQKTGKISLPFGRGRSSPIDSNDVAEVTVKCLLDPAKYQGRVLELTGSSSIDMDALAAEYAAALGRPIEYEDVPLDAFYEGVLQKLGIPEHTAKHLRTVCAFFAAGKFDWSTKTVEEILGRPASSMYDTLKDARNGFPIPPKTS
ncbi:NAD(P)-binding protein [Xylariaceae sp. FL1651]|nr:NAD(P)-binding protein [Xylariaceae sp. FL1651]